MIGWATIRLVVLFVGTSCFAGLKNSMENQLHDATEGMREQMRQDVLNLDEKVLRYLPVVTESVKSAAFKARSGGVQNYMTLADCHLSSAAYLLLRGEENVDFDKLVYELRTAAANMLLALCFVMEERDVANVEKEAPPLGVTEKPMDTF